MRFVLPADFRVNIEQAYKVLQHPTRNEVLMCMFGYSYPDGMV